MASLARLHNIETQTHLQPLQPWEYDLENVHSLLDEFIQRASKCPSSPSSSSSPTSVSGIDSSFNYANGGSEERAIWKVEKLKHG